MLFKTTQEIKTCLPANAAFEFKDIEPFIRLQAEPNYLIPVLSQEQYNELDTKYNEAPENLTNDEKQLLDLSRFVVANFAYLLYLPWGQVIISKGGIHIESSDTKKAAFTQHTDDLKVSTITAGWSGIENLLKFLEAKKGTFTAWAGSSTYTVLKESFINTAEDFHEYFAIDKSRLTFLAIKHLMKRVEKSFIRNTIGTALYTTIRTQIVAGTVNPANKTLLEEYIKPAIANLTMAAALKQLSVRITGDGIVVLMGSMSNNTKYFIPSPIADLREIREQALSDGIESLSNLRDYLNEKASGSLYADYFNSDLYVPADSTPPSLNNENRGIVGI